MYTNHLKNYQVNLLVYKNGFATSVTGTDWHEVC